MIFVIMASDFARTQNSQVDHERLVMPTNIIWLTVFLYAAAVGSAVAAVILLRRLGRTAPVAQEVCGKCGFARIGLPLTASCPECGESRWIVSVRTSHVAQLACRVALGAVGPLTAGGVVCSAFLALQPPGSPTLPLVIATAPWVVGAIGAGLVLGSRCITWAAFIAVIVTSIAGNAALLIFLSRYWAVGPSIGDYGWPLTDLAIFSLALGAGFVLGLVLILRRLRR